MICIRSPKNRKKNVILHETRRSTHNDQNACQRGDSYGQKVCFFSFFSDIFRVETLEYSCTWYNHLKHRRSNDDDRFNEPSQTLVHAHPLHVETRRMATKHPPSMVETTSIERVPTVCSNVSKFRSLRQTAKYSRILTEFCLFALFEKSHSRDTFSSGDSVCTRAFGIFLRFLFCSRGAVASDNAWTYVSHLRHASFLLVLNIRRRWNREYTTNARQTSRRSFRSTIFSFVHRGHRRLGSIDRY